MALCVSIALALLSCSLRQFRIARRTPQVLAIRHRKLEVGQRQQWTIINTLVPRAAEPRDLVQRKAEALHLLGERPRIDGGARVAVVRQHRRVVEHALGAAALDEGSQRLVFDVWQLTPQVEPAGETVVLEKREDGVEQDALVGANGPVAA